MFRCIQNCHCNISQGDRKKRYQCYFQRRIHHNHKRRLRRKETIRCSIGQPPPPVLWCYWSRRRKYYLRRYHSWYPLAGHDRMQGVIRHRNRQDQNPGSPCSNCPYRRRGDRHRRRKKLGRIQLQRYPLARQEYSSRSLD